MNSSSIDFLAEIAFIAAIVVMVGCTLYFSRRIKNAMVPMQWGFDGNPTWYAPRLVGLWGPIGLALAFRLLISGIERYVPDQVHNVAYSILVFSVVVAAVHVGFLMAVARWASKQ